jgi:hypothetical protein
MDSAVDANTEGPNRILAIDHHHEGNSVGRAVVKENWAMIQRFTPSAYRWTRPASRRPRPGPAPRTPVFGAQQPHEH